MARKNPDTMTLLLLGGAAAAAIYLFTRKKPAKAAVAATTAPAPFNFQWKTFTSPATGEESRYCVDIAGKTVADRFCPSAPAYKMKRLVL
jgi:hypothetical protein